MSTSADTNCARSCGGFTYSASAAIRQVLKGHRDGGRRMMDLSGAAVVGTGRTAYTRRSGRTGFALAAEAIRIALADAGLTTVDVDGITCFSTGDPASPLQVSHAIGIDEIAWSVKTLAGDNQVALVMANAAAALATGQADVVVVYRVLDADVRYGKVTDGTPGSVEVGGWSGSQRPTAIWSRRSGSRVGAAPPPRLRRSRDRTRPAHPRRLAGRP